jgi:predicted dehydrogenase
VFVEKPLALDEDGLRAVEQAAATSSGILMVGFNRRFAPLTQVLRDALCSRGPMVMTCRVNAGRLPEGHWTHHPELGGGRIVGEMCHFVDLLSYLAGSPPRFLGAAAVGGGSEPREDNVCATLGFADGSVGQIVYSAFGDSSLPKERIEVLGEVGAGALSDFRELKLHRGGQSETASRRRDKGHGAELRCFVEACRSGRQPWPASDMVAVMRATFAIRDAVQASPAAATT